MTNSTTSWNKEIIEFCKSANDPKLVSFSHKRQEDDSLWGQAVCLGSFSRLLRSDNASDIKKQARTYYKKVEPESVKALIKILESTVFDMYRDVANCLATTEANKDQTEWTPILDLREEVACINEILRYNEVVSFILPQFDDWCQQRFEDFKVTIQQDSTPILNLARRNHNNWWLGKV